MKCSTCVKEGKRSEVFGGMSTTTLMGHTPYWDDDGNRHVHDPNWTTTEYQCSRGHKWSVSSQSRCPSCDWGCSGE